MNPINIDVLEKKKIIILQEIELLKRIAATPVDSSTDILIRHALCHSMQNAISAVINMAQHIVSEKSDSVPESYSEAIPQLGLIGSLLEEFASEFSRVAKLRNVLVHLYDSVDINFIFSLLPKFLKDVKRFLKELVY